jgi:hypothetical protein
VEDRPSNNWYHFALQIIFGCLWLRWHFHIPPPNKSILAMATMVALMMLADMKPSHKSIYFLLVVAFFILENRAINKDRVDSEVASKAIALRMETTANSQEEISNRTKDLLDEITGGDSFPEVMADVLGNGELRFSITSMGKHNLTDLRINIMSHMQRKDLHYVTQQTMHPIVLSVPIAPTHAVIGISMPVTVKWEGDLDVFQIDISARNGTFMEMLDIKKGGRQGWHEDLEIYNMHGSTLLLKSPGFDSN